MNMSTKRTSRRGVTDMCREVNMKSIKKSLRSLHMSVFSVQIYSDTMIALFLSSTLSFTSTSSFSSTSNPKIMLHINAFQGNQAQATTGGKGRESENRLEGGMQAVDAGRRVAARPIMSPSLHHFRCPCCFRSCAIDDVGKQSW